MSASVMVVGRFQVTSGTRFLLMAHDRLNMCLVLDSRFCLVVDSRLWWVKDSRLCLVVDLVMAGGRVLLMADGRLQHVFVGTW